MKRSIVLILGSLLLAPSGCAREPDSRSSKPTATEHIVIGPYVQPGRYGVLTSSLRVVWWSDVPGKAALEYEADNGWKGTLEADTVTLDGLYRHSADLISVDAIMTETVRATVTVNGTKFASAPQKVSFPGGRPKTPLRFAALGDTGAGTVAEKHIADQVLARKPEILIIPGDVVYNSGEFSEYKSRFFPYFGDLMKTVPVLPVMGNHDTGNPANMGRPFCEVWMPPTGFTTLPDHKPPYTVLKRRANKGEGPVPASQQALRNYSVDVRDCHFVGLDTTVDHDTLRDFIVPWLKTDLKKAKETNNARWLIAFWHHPPYTHGAYRDNSLQWRDIRDLVLPVLHEAGVQIVLNGHDHNYQHMKKDGIDYIITGGGGAKLYPVTKEYSGNDQPPLLGWNDSVHSFTMFEESEDGRKMTVQQIDENGHQLDAFSLSLPR